MMFINVVDKRNKALVEVLNCMNKMQMLMENKQSKHAM
jgi:hypothetical protein